MILKKATTIVIIMALFVFGLVSCAHSNTHPNVKKILPRKAFVHLEKALVVKSCNNNQCISTKFRSSASGFIVNKQKDGVFIITAAHFCENTITSSANITASVFFKARRLDGTIYGATLLHYQKDIDVCLIYSKGLVEEIDVIKIAPRRADPGEKVFNIGAPASIVGPNMVPILEGRYNGDIGKTSFYTLPAYPGSSGSMILNEHGELIGMVHSVFMNFNSITLGTRYEELKYFINKELYRFVLYKNVMKDLNLDDMFTTLN